MKLTKAELKKIIKEELDRFAEAEEDAKGDAVGAAKQMKSGLLDLAKALTRNSPALQKALGKLAGDELKGAQAMALIANMLGWDAKTFAGNAVKVRQQLQLLAKKAEPEAAPEEQPAP